MRLIERAAEGAGVLLLVLAPHSTAAQTATAPSSTAQFEAVPSSSDIRAMLQSTDPRKQAWGAWWTAQGQVKGMESLLQKNLEDHYQGNTVQDEAVMDTTLDAYIQSSVVPPPVSLLKAVYSRRPSQALILLARTPPSSSADAVLLELLKSEAGLGTGTEWYAIANLLLDHHAAGFAVTLMQSVHVREIVNLCETRPCDVEANLSVEFGGEGMLPSIPAPGLPPWPIYTLSQQLQSPAVPQRSNTTLVFGPVVVTYRRAVMSVGSTPSEVQSSHGWQVSPPHPTDDDRLRYIGALSALTSQVSYQEFLQIQWSGPDAFTREVSRFREDIRQRLTSLVQLLLYRGLLSAEEAATLASPIVDIEIHDHRALKTPLPDLPR